MPTVPGGRNTPFLSHGCAGGSKKLVTAEWPHTCHWWMEFMFRVGEWNTEPRTPLVGSSNMLFQATRGLANLRASVTGKSTLSGMLQKFRSFRPISLLFKLMFCYLILFAFIALTFTLLYLYFLILMTFRTSRQGILVEQAQSIFYILQHSTLILPVSREGEVLLRLLLVLDDRREQEALYYTVGSTRYI